MRPIRARFFGSLTLLLAVVLALASAGSGSAARKVNKREVARAQEVDGRMSSMGLLAARARVELSSKAGAGFVTNAGPTGESPDVCVNDPACRGGYREGPVGGQAELSIAVDETGQHIVVGYNDTRGFSLNPVTLSGVMYSDDGGDTFVDAGQLPTPGTDFIGATRLPQIFGDPEVKYLGECTFLYSSIMLKKFTAPTPTTGTTAQTMSVHRSTDCGHTWAGPFEVTSATNPNGLVSGSGAPLDAADKEFMDVDPETGRVMLSWSNFTPVAPGGVEITVTYSDDAKTGNPPVWSTGVVVGNTDADGQASIPRFAGNGSNDVYVAWRRFPFPGSFFGLGQTVGFARSTDNGATWGPAVDLGPEFFTMDQVLGNDRVNTSPSMAVDNSGGRHRGNVYVVYADNNNNDGADVAFQKSTDGGVTFSAPIKINSRPGNDRPQWFPWVTVDTHTGRVYVFYYDQGIAQSGDLTEASYVFSDDGGRRWSKPLPLSDRPFKAGWGNDTGQPNLGDYNQAVAQRGELFVAYAGTSRPPLGFADGQPTSGNMTVPDVVFKRVSRCDWETNELAVSLAGVSVKDISGNPYIDPKDLLRADFKLSNYVTNPISAKSINGLRAWLKSSTPGVHVLLPWGVYPKLSPGESGSNLFPYLLRVDNSFVPGTEIELELHVWGPRFRTAVLHHTLFTGTPQTTTLFAENFEGAPTGTLPVGWATSHAGGANVVPWTTSNTFAPAPGVSCNTSNGAFHQNRDDNGISSATRFERLFSPTFLVPTDADYVTIDFDVCYDTEDFPPFNVYAFDGFLLRVTDSTPGRLLRSNLVEAFADEFTTGLFQHYPKHFPRSSSSAYFQDMSAWAGESGRSQARPYASARHGGQHRPTPLRVHPGQRRHLRRPAPGAHLRRLRRQHRGQQREISGAVAPGRRPGGSRQESPGPFDTLVDLPWWVSAPGRLCVARLRSVPRNLDVGPFLFQALICAQEGLLSFEPHRDRPGLGLRF